MELAVKIIDHLGIVSSICDDAHVVQIIDSIVPKDKSMKVSIGTRVKAMVINCLGFTTKPMYIAYEFYKNRPIDLLLGNDIMAEDLNDDSLGRALDVVYEIGPELIFSAVLGYVVPYWKIKTNELHLDTTSISVEGDYRGAENEQLIRFGHSKDLRDDLKQFILSSLTTIDGGIPIVYQALAGNTADSKHFNEAISALKNNATIVPEGTTVVFDAAGYNKLTIGSIDWITWISRAPNTINEVKDVKLKALGGEFTEIGGGYSLLEKSSAYGDVQQRWIVVKSEQALNREKKTTLRDVKKERKGLEAKARELSSKLFSCEEDAKRAVAEVSKKLKFHAVALNKISTESNVSGKKKCIQHEGPAYRVHVEIADLPEKIKETIALNGMFVIATNELDSKKLSAEEVLRKYKNQSCVEKGFRFLKDPMCMVNSIYLKSAPRIKALSMIMFLSLLIYSLAERILRNALVETNQTVKNQVKKDIQNPTMKRVFQTMEGVVVVKYVENEKDIVEIKNLTDELRKIIKLLGHSCMKTYMISS